jgi:DNA-binding MarR family transcriptional regulator
MPMSTQPPHDLSDPEYQVLARFRFALRVFLRYSEEAARAVGVTPNQHQLMLAIRGFPSGQPTISDVAEWLQLRRHSVGELIDRAIEADLVQRQADSDDRRRQRLALTPRGADILASLSAAHQVELKRFREDLAQILHQLP